MSWCHEELGTRRFRREESKCLQCEDLLAVLEEQKGGSVLLLFSLLCYFPASVGAMILEENRGPNQAKLIKIWQTKVSMF